MNTNEIVERAAKECYAYMIAGGFMSDQQTAGLAQIITRACEQAIEVSTREAEADTKRLNWLTFNANKFTFTESGQTCWKNRWFAGLRAAIDEAMKK
jgi:hypothetical protein